jgi:methylated-DNA-protein-cysteine methyltransferase related protein
MGKIPKRAGSRGDSRTRVSVWSKAPQVSSEEMRRKILRTIGRIPHGKVSTYGGVAAAAGFPGRARLVARALHGSHGVPWQRVLGAGGAIKLEGESAFEQRFRLQAEGVAFRGKKVDMKRHEHHWKGGKAQPKKAPSNKGKSRRV